MEHCRETLWQSFTEGSFVTSCEKLANTMSSLGMHTFTEQRMANCLTKDGKKSGKNIRKRFPSLVVKIRRPNAPTLCRQRTSPAGLPVLRKKRVTPQRRKPIIQRRHLTNVPPNFPKFHSRLDLLRSPPEILSCNCFLQPTFDNCVICPSNSLSFTSKAAIGSSTDSSALPPD
jgi:hypothetical protein